MKKEIYLALGLSVAGAINANFPFKDEHPRAVAVAKAQDDKRIQIKAEELPEPVKKSLAEGKYKAWEVQTAYRVKTTIEYYEITLVKETETKSIKIDANGKLIDEVK
jgi:hypothetical protein